MFMCLTTFERLSVTLSANILFAPSVLLGLSHVHIVLLDVL